MKYRNLISIFIIIPLSILQFLILIECCLRFLGYKKNFIPFSFISLSSVYQTDPELIYKQKANLQISAADLYTNTLGLKTVPTRLVNSNKNKDVILILGDSAVWGNTISTETYPAQLKNLTEDENKNLEVLNAGIPGYGSDQEYLFFNKYILPKTKLKILIWNINYNDIFDNMDRPVFDLINNKLVSIPQWKNGIFLSAKIADILPNSINKNSLSINWILFNISKIRLFNISKEKSIDKIVFQIKDMQKMASKNGIRLIIAITPSKSIVDNLPAKKITLEGIQKIKAKITDIEQVDQNDYLIRNKLTSDLKNSNDKVLGITSDAELFLNENKKFPPEAWHPNSLGNYLMAKSIMEKISE